MAGRDEPLLDRIERGALDPKSDLAGVLRLCIALGGRSGSSELREWATTELKGYPAPADVPQYRVIPVPILADFISGNYHVTSQEISSLVLPEWARDIVGPEVRLSMGVGEVAAHAARGETVRLGPSAGPDLVAWMNENTVEWPQQIQRIYYTVGPPAFAGVLDAVRTTLVELVAEIRAGLPTAEAEPTASLTDQAVNVAVHGSGNRIQVTTASNAPATATAQSDSPGARQKTGRQKSRTIRGQAVEHPLVTAIIVLATVVGAVAAVFALL